MCTYEVGVILQRQAGLGKKSFQITYVCQMVNRYDSEYDVLNVPRRRVPGCHSCVNIICHRNETVIFIVTISGKLF